MNLNEVRRVPLAHLPTPLEYLPRLTDFFGGPRLYVKRDDQTGLACGGNKARKLEYLLADALDQGCDTLVTTGGPQSNHARQTAAAAAKFGLACALLLPRVVPRSTTDYESSGNLLLDELLGADIRLFAAEDLSQATIDAFLASLTTQGKRPYFIPTGGSTPLGALGYASAASELLNQAARQELAIDHIVVPTGSGGTHAGIVAGLVQAGHGAKVHGIAVAGTTDARERLVRNLAGQTLGLLSSPTGALDARVQVNDRFVGPGYGLPTDAMIEAVRLTARCEGLLLDPVYTGKAMAGLIDSLRRGEFSPRENVIFWHTGGTPALFAYREIFASESLPPPTR